MNRLTKKETNCLAGNGYRKCDYLLDGTSKVEALNKLGQYEDLEDELNFDLEIVIKALLNGVYCTHSVSERNYFSGTELSISGNHEALVVYENNVYWITKNGERIKQQRTIYKRFEFKDYGKTWALCKEDLEDER